jgi:hypothetical protein
MRARSCKTHGLLTPRDRATVGKRGNPTGTNQHVDGESGDNNNVMVSSKPERGNSARYAIRKLRQDAPELRPRLGAGEIDAHAVGRLGLEARDHGDLHPPGYRKLAESPHALAVG